LLVHIIVLRSPLLDLVVQVLLNTLDIVDGLGPRLALFVANRSIILEDVQGLVRSQVINKVKRVVLLIHE